MKNSKKRKHPKKTITGGVFIFIFLFFVGLGFLVPTLSTYHDGKQQQRHGSLPLNSFVVLQSSGLFLVLLLSAVSSFLQLVLRTFILSLRYVFRNQELWVWQIRIFFEGEANIFKIWKEFNIYAIL